MTENKSKFNGIIPAIITPFTADKKIDEEKFVGNLKFLLDCGVHCILVNGSTGMAGALSREERKITIKLVLDTVNKKVPVIAGTGSASTRETIEFSKDAQEMGADAILVITPFNLIPTKKGLIDHYKAINEAVSIPIILYNLPQHTGVDITVDELKELCKLNNVAGLKDSSGDISRFAEIVRLFGDRISVLNGGDDQILPALAVGANGMILALGNIVPKQLVAIYNNMQEGKLTEARNIFHEILPIAGAISASENFPSQVYEAVSQLGRGSIYVREPIVPQTKEEKEIITQALKHGGLL